MYAVGGLCVCEMVMAASSFPLPLFHKENYTFDSLPAYNKGTSANSHKIVH